jgi:hypothetical protein
VFAAGWFTGWAAHPASAPAALPGPPPVDGQDPYIAGCGADQEELQHLPIRWADGSGYGELVLFHSVKCQASWGYVYGPNAPAWTVHITAVRAADHRSAPSAGAGQVGKPNSWGNMLSTARGCVLVEAFVQTPDGVNPTATSSCYASSGPVVTATG